MKQYCDSEIQFYKRLFEEFIDRDLLNSQHKAKEYAEVAKSNGDVAFVALFEALAHDGPSRKSKEIAVRILEPWYEKLFNVSHFEFYVSYYAALLMAIGHPDALRVCDEILQIYPDSFQALTSKGIILRRHKKYKEAINLFNKALKIRPNSPWPSHHLEITEKKIEPPITITAEVKPEKKRSSQKVFMGHSGDASREIAECLEKLLKEIFLGLDVLYSEDIPGGKKFFPIILSNLSESDCGVFCITEDNYDSPWIHFEAGALSLSISEETEEKLIIPFLFNMKKIRKKDGEEYESPLKQYQFAFATKKGILTLLMGINERSTKKFSKEELIKEIDNRWDELQRKFKKISEIYKL